MNSTKHFHIILPRLLRSGLRDVNEGKITCAFLFFNSEYRVLASFIDELNTSRGLHYSATKRVQQHRDNFLLLSILTRIQLGVYEIKATRVGQ